MTRVGPVDVVVALRAEGLRDLEAASSHRFVVDDPTALVTATESFGIGPHAGGFRTDDIVYANPPIPVASPNVTSAAGWAEWPFVGREDELQRIATALGRADATGVVLAGPAGLGKTRLAEECLRIAEAAGFATARAAATRAAAAVPLGAFAQLLPTTAAVGEQRVDLVQEAVRSIAALGDSRPLMLVVDDAHLLDDASASAVHQLVLSEQAFAVTTVRSDAPVSDAIVALWKDLGAERIDLEPLRRADTERLISAALSGPVDGATVRDLFDASQGNPLYLRELLLGGRDTGLLREEEGLWRFTVAPTTFPRLAALIEARLADLTDAEQEVLDLVALGEPLELDVLAAFADLTFVESLERRGLANVVTDDREARVRLAHPQYGEVVRTRMPKVRAMLVYRQLADAVDATAPASPEGVIRLALWRLDGGASVEPELLLEAARRAFFAHDVGLAERLARLAHDGSAGPASGQLLGEALAGLGRHDEAEAILAETEATATSDEQRALAAMARAQAFLWGLGQAADADAVVVDAEQRLTPGPWRDELLGMRAIHRLLAGQPASAVDMVDEMITTGEGRPLVEAAIAGAPALAVMGRCDEAVALADRGLAEHVALGDLLEMSHPGIHVVAKTLALGEAGRLGEALELARSGYDAALAERRADGQAWFAMLLGRVALLQGAVSTAARWFREGAAVYRDLGQAGPRRWCLAGVVLSEAMAGNATPSRVALAELDVTASPMLMMEPDVIRARAWHALMTGQPVAATDQLQRAAGLAHEGGAWALEASAVHDLARIGAPERAVDRLRELATVVDGALTAIRARHADALARHDGAAIEDASQQFERVGACCSFAGLRRLPVRRRAIAAPTVLAAPRGVRAARPSFCSPAKVPAPLPSRSAATQLSSAPVSARSRPSPRKGCRTAISRSSCSCQCERSRATCTTRSPSSASRAGRSWPARSAADRTRRPVPGRSRGFSSRH